MRYLITFLEGLISFLSPCMLPMLPVFLSYFAPGGEDSHPALPRAAAFVLGFTAVFCALGVFAGSVGMWLSHYRQTVNIVCGAVVILLGMGYMNVIPLPFFKGMQTARPVTGLFSAFVFGMIYSVSLTPCVGAFLGSALMLASSGGTALLGFSLLLTYSLGLGIPFLLSAVLLEQLRGLFDSVKAHYRVINLVSGLFLTAIGAAMCLGWLDKLLALFG